MTVSYTNTFADAVALYKRHLAGDTKHQERRRTWIYYLPLGLILGKIMGTWIGGHPFDLAKMVAACTLSLILFLLGWCYYRTYARRAVKRLHRHRPQPEVLCPHTAIISDTAFTIRTGDKIESHSWPALHHIAFTPNHIFLYDTPTTAHILPKRDLGEETFTTAAATIRQHTSKN